MCVAEQRGKERGKLESKVAEVHVRVASGPWLTAEL